MPAIDKIPSGTNLPKRATAAIIGGGIIGVATALELAERGLDVVLFEKGEIAAEQSSRNWGWCRQMGRDAREIPLIFESLKLWRGMNERLGADTSFTQCGIVYLCETDAQLAAKEKWYAENAKPFGLNTKLISGAEAENLMPGASRQWRGALYTSADGRAEPFIAVPAMALVAPQGCKNFHQLRRAWTRIANRPRLRCCHRTRHCRLRYGGARRWRLVAPLLPQYRN